MYGGQGRERHVRVLDLALSKKASQWRGNAMARYILKSFSNLGRMDFWKAWSEAEKCNRFLFSFFLKSSQKNWFLTAAIMDRSTFSIFQGGWCKQFVPYVKIFFFLSFSIQRVQNNYVSCTIRCLSKVYKNTDSKAYMHPGVYSHIINNSQLMERPQMSTDWWMNQEDVVWQWNALEYYWAIKKNEILLFATLWLELHCIWLSKISLRKTNPIWFHSYVGFKKQNIWT